MWRKIEEKQKRGGKLKKEEQLGLGPIIGVMIKHDFYDYYILQVKKKKK